MKVAVISAEKALEIQGTEYVSGVMFNPVEYNGKWVISLMEAEYLNPEDILEIIEYVPIFIDEE